MSSVIGVEQEIRADAVYTMPEFSRRTSLKRDAIRAARQQGFEVLRMHGRVFVRGSDWLAYCDAQAKKSAE